MRLHGVILCLLAFLLSVTGGSNVPAQDAAIEELKQEMKTPAETNQPVVTKPAAVSPAAEDLQPVPANPAPVKQPEPLIEELAPVKPAVEKPAASAVEKPVEKPAEPVIEKPAEVKPPAPLIEELAPAQAAAEKPAEPVVARPATTPAVEPIAEKPKAEAAVAPAIPVEATKVEPAAPKTEAPEISKPLVTEESVKQLGSKERTDMAKLIAQQEEVRRQARELEGRMNIEAADKAWKSGDYTVALDKYRAALEKLPVNSGTMAFRNRAVARIPDCEYQTVLAVVRAGKTDEALAKGKQILDKTPDNKPLAKLVARLESEKTKVQPGPERTKEAVEIENKTEAQQQMLFGKQQLAARQFDKARASFESVLAIEPENPEAMRFLKEIGDRKYVSSANERLGTIANMNAQVRDAWNPQYKLIKGKAEPAKEPEKISGSENILKKMEKIIIPEIEFRQANIHDVVDFLNKASVEGDKGSDQTQRGINIILNLNPAGGGAAPAAPAATKPAGGENLFEATPAGGAPAGGQTYEITFTARYISLLSALKIITSVAGLKWRVDGNIVMIVPQDFDPAEIEVRMYPVEPTIFDKIKQANESAPAAAAQIGGREVTTIQPGAEIGGLPDLEEFFKKMGVKFPKGSSISYNSTMGKVILANTSENLATFEKILPELNLVPKQVEIEARFVEVNETDLQELGLEWLLSDAYEIASKKGGAFTPLGSTERIQMNANSTDGGFTKGMRFWGTDTGNAQTPLASGKGTLGRLASISSVLTNPELTMVLHMLQQNGNADLLSAPKVTTRSGAEASIRVVTEFIYPTSFEVQGGTQNASTSGAQTTVTETTVVPQDFATREVGVILTVLPEVSPDGNMINLTMTPQVVTDPTWFQYGSTIRRGDGSTLTLNMPQPFFHVRSLNTQISIYDGATVVMGGLITEDLQKVNDKIPILGDIPLIGALFRSKSEQSIKKNLLIFVTAKLVDPAGRLIRNPEAEASSQTKAPAAAPTPAAAPK